MKPAPRPGRLRLKAKHGAELVIDRPSTIRVLVRGRRAVLIVEALDAKAPHLPRREVTA